MIWFAHKTYTREFFAAGLSDLCRSARLSNRVMAAVAGAAVLVMVAVQAGVIYAL